MSDVGEVRYSVLGPLRVRVAGRPVELGPGRRRSTLAALLVDAGRVVSVDALTERVWDGAAPENPQASLHVYVSRLRSALRTVDQDGREVSARLLTEAPGYRLDVADEDVDVVRFQRLVREARAARAADPRSARALVAKALALWRGDPYADVAAEFARAEAARLRAARASAQELAVELDLELGLHATVVDQIDALLADEPLREPLHLAKILALYRSGRQAEALRHFEHVRRLLAEELGVDPSRELRDLHAAVLRQDRSLTVPSAVDPVSPPPARPDDGPVAELRMVGRDGQLAQVVREVRAAWGEGEQIGVSVVGEAGIGKSRLLEEAALRLQQSGGVVAWGRCWQHEGAPALWPWVQLLRATAAAVPPAVVATAVGGRGAAVTRLVPELAGDVAARPAEAGPESLEESQVQLFDAVVAFFRSVADGLPVLLVLEDMHWSDPLSRRLTEYFVTNARGRNLAVLISVRSPTEDAATAGQELLAAFVRTGRVSRLGLTGLDRDAVRLYVADRTRTTLDDATAQALLERTEGNPFFVGEIVRLLVTDEPAESERLATEVPASVREVILRRLHRLGAEQLDVLRSAAVVGRSFDLDLLQDISGAPTDAVDEAVDRATAAGFLGSDPADPQAHRFTHALVQQALVEDTGPARRRRLHGRIAEALQRRGGTRSVDRLIHHLALAGGPENLSRAARLSLTAADDARRRFHHLEVERLLLQALDLTGRLDGGAVDELELGARVRLCSLYDYAYGPAYPATVVHRERALRLARGSGTAHDRLAALSSAAALTLARADFVGTSVLVQEMLVTAEATGDDVLEATARFIDGMSLLQREEYVPAVAALSRAIAVVERFDTAPWVAVVATPLEAVWGWRLMAATMLGQDDGPQARADLARCEALAASPIGSVSSNVRGQRALIHVLHDELGPAASAAREAVELASDSGNTSVRDYLGVAAVWGSAEPSEAELDEALAPFLGPGEVLMRPFMLELAADAHLRMGRPGPALARHREAVTAAARTGNTFLAPGPARRLAALAARGASVIDVERRSISERAG